MIIPGFTRYTFEEGIVTDTEIGKVKNAIKRGSKLSYKLKDDAGTWRGISESKVRALCGDMLNKPLGAKILPGSDNCWVSPLGEVYTTSIVNPRGTILKHYVDTSGYLTVRINNKHQNVHKLVAQTFLMSDYIEKGLVCMHLDDDKSNCNLSNLKIGTYSQNNLDAYATGVNPGKQSRQS